MDPTFQPKIIWYGLGGNLPIGAVTFSDVGLPAAAPEPQQSHDCICPDHYLGWEHVPECPWPKRPKGSDQ